MNQRQILTLSEIQSTITESNTNPSYPILTFVCYYCYINEEILIVDGVMNELVSNELKYIEVCNQYEVDPLISYDEIGIKIIYVVEDELHRKRIRYYSKKDIKIYKKIQYIVPIEKIENK
jgi:hypothetical protein